MSKHDAEKAGYDDALMLDWRGYVVEGTGANFFMITPDNIINTPPPDCFLNGITRQTVIQLANERKYEIIERHIRPEELKIANEIFVTGTAAEVTPVGKIDELEYSVGEITKALRSDYEKLVGRSETKISAA
jgi:branched-chain amino acid aminotransferase